MFISKEITLNVYIKRIATIFTENQFEKKNNVEVNSRRN